MSPPHMGGEELDYIHQAFEKNWIAPLGDNVNGFEKDLSEYTGVAESAVVTSGTAAIHLALILCGVKPGDEVLCQSFTFTATANPIRYLGAHPVFIDSETKTWNMDPESLENAIQDRMKKNGGSKPGAIIVVHLYGMPAQMDRIMEIGSRYGIPVIEDAAEALGSSIAGSRCGSFGKISVLSFNGNKIITTSGGGALLSGDAALVKKARFLATQARDNAPHYQHSELGYNYRMSNITAGIGRGQMKVLDSHVQRRREIHDEYFEMLDGEWISGDVLERLNEGKYPHKREGSSKGIYFLKEPDGYRSNRWLTTIIVNPGETGGVTREDIRKALEDVNIESRPLWKPMHLQPLYKSSVYYGKKVSETLFQYGLCLPSGSSMSSGHVNLVSTVIKKLMN